jgi:DNA-binding NarL/FixJ family response regulator
MRVLIVDDHEVIWSGMRGVVERLLAQQQPPPSLEWHAARDVPSALALAAFTAFAPGDIATDARAPAVVPDLILLDYHLPGPSGLEALRVLRERFEAASIVVLSGDQRPDQIRRVIEAGAAGYIPKTVSEQEMVAALGLVLAHGIYLPALALLEVAPAVEAGDAPLANDALPGFVSAELSPRQREVFARALRGMPNKLIGRELGIAEGTVKIHLAMVYRALGVRNRTEAMYRVLSADAAAAIGPP